MRLKSILKLNQLSKNLGFVLALLLCLKDSLLSSFFAGKGFSEVADWLRVPGVVEVGVGSWLVFAEFWAGCRWQT